MFTNYPGKVVEEDARKVLYVGSLKDQPYDVLMKNVKGLD
jgi:hypothetical protein